MHACKLGLLKEVTIVEQIDIISELAESQLICVSQSTRRLDMTAHVLQSRLKQPLC